MARLDHRRRAFFGSFLVFANLGKIARLSYKNQRIDTLGNVVKKEHLKPLSLKNA